jgi:hypothetical protein
MVFELLFIFFVLVSLVLCVTAVVFAVGGRRDRAKRLLPSLGISWIVYLSIVCLIAAVTPQQIIPANRDLCFDEMCFAVVNVQTAYELGPSNHHVRAKGAFRIVTVRVSSRARRRVQSEGGLRALLWSPGGEYQSSASAQHAWEATHPQSVALTSRLRPGQSVFSDQVFDVPPEAVDLALVLTHGFTPGYFVIGECPLFHKPTILRLPV